MFWLPGQKNEWVNQRSADVLLCVDQPSVVIPVGAEDSDSFRTPKSESASVA